MKTFKKNIIINIKKKVERKKMHKKPQKKEIKKKKKRRIVETERQERDSRAEVVWVPLNNDFGAVRLIHTKLTPT